MTIISLAAAVWVVCAPGAQAQTPLPPANDPVVTPKFVPAGQRPSAGIVQAGFTQPLELAPQPIRDVQRPNAGVVQAAHTQLPKVETPRRPLAADDSVPDLNLHTDLPGQQLLFKRESEANMYERIRQAAPRSNAAIFPTDEPVISKESYVQPAYPRLDPRTKQPFAQHVETVEPCYVMHRRLLFEQPNFERGLYDFGPAQPLVSLGVFYYDVALAPYHIWSDLRDRNESSVGKCLPGDPAPFLVPCEKFSVTGLVGEAGTIFGLSFLFP